MKLIQDHPAGVEFALQSGKFIQNFGLIDSDVAVEISREVPLAKRIDIVRDRDTKMPAKKKREPSICGSRLEIKGCELRNTVAHGTVGLAIAGEQPTGELQAVGILKVKKWQDTDEMVGIAEIKDAVNTTGQIVRALNGLLENV